MSRKLSGTWMRCLVAAVAVVDMVLVGVANMDAEVDARQLLVPVCVCFVDEMLSGR